MKIRSSEMYLYIEKMKPRSRVPDREKRKCQDSMARKKEKSQPEAASKDLSTSFSVKSKVLIVLIAIICWYLNYQHVFNLFENDKHFSHLADFEREMAYRTEMGLYYSYYKTIINAESFGQGLSEITHDRVTEHGHEINTLKRFNLYPEVILAFIYRPFRAMAKQFDWSVETCWQVNRGNLKPVHSCEGIGNPHYFYVTSVFLISGTVASSIFLLGVIVSDSIIGGILSVFCFAFNHGEATRVQWTPPLRESFAFPFIIAHIVLLSYIIKHAKNGVKWVLMLASLSIPAMLFWQFTQFALFTQIASVVAAHSMDLIRLETTKTVIKSHAVSFVVSFVLMFGNEMMLTALYMPSICAFAVIVFMPMMGRLTFRPFYVLMNVFLFVLMTVGLKMVLSKGLQIEDDAHIFDILRSKFTNYSNFHTRLYTCSAEFDFIQYQTVAQMTSSLLIPMALGGVVLYLAAFIRQQYRLLIWRNELKHENGEIFYNICQLVCYTVMAWMIMRLKLFMTPHLCSSVAILANRQLVERLTGRKLSNVYYYSSLVALLAALSYQGMPNIQKQLSIRGEYSNPDQEMLFEWIEKETKPSDVFAGTMPVMANVKLTTLRPIVNHPHYEDVGIRERTLKVYSMFSKKPLKEVHAELKRMGVNYFVFQLMNCSNDERRPECVYRGMWDEHDPKNKEERTSLCDLWILAANSDEHKRIEPFRIVYNYNRNYVVLKI